MVMVLHFYQGGGFAGFHLSERCLRLSILGGTGVDLFFVLSGFLITRILIATRRDLGYFRNFYVRRLLRIVPLYYAFLVLYYFALPLFDHRAIVGFNKTWWYWVYLQNIPDTFPGFEAVGPIHYWSLAVEEHFYLFWPLLVYCLPPHRLARVSACLALRALAVRFALLRYTSADVFYFTLCRMDALAFGTLLACLEAGGELERWRTRFLVLLGCLAPLLLFVWTQASGEGAMLVQLLKYSAVGLIYLAVLGLTVIHQHSRIVASVFANRPLRLTGKISYGLYVYHTTCFGYLLHYVSAKRHPFPCFLACFAGTFTVSWLSYMLFEARFLRLKRLFSYESSTPLNQIGANGRAIRLAVQQTRPTPRLND